MTFLVGNGITLYRWLALRKAVELEMSFKAKGLPRPFRRSMTALAKKELGVRGGPHAVLDALTVKIEEVGMNLKPGEVQP